MFDDSDFYQVLLKELISLKSPTAAHATATPHFPQQHTNKRTNMNSKFNKDRTVKYSEVMDKLVNYMTRRTDPRIHHDMLWHEEMAAELFKSLEATSVGKVNQQVVE